MTVLHNDKEGESCHVVKHSIYSHPAKAGTKLIFVLEKGTLAVEVLP